MYAYDFEYDGRQLSEFGFMVCSFDGEKGIQAADKGSEITFQFAPSGYGRRHYVTGLQYENRLSTSFQIAKNPEMFSDKEMEVTSDEFRELSRWLNRKEFLWFHSWDWCEPEKERPWFRASFTLTRLDIGGATYGIQLDMTTDAPFGYGPEEVITMNFTAANQTKTMRDLNDEIGDTYPEMQITCRAGGTLTLQDDLSGCYTQVKNVTSGEVITFSGDSMIISSSLPAHSIADDFNYEFFRFANTYSERENQITSSIPCDIVMRYRPIRKDSI